MVLAGLILSGFFLLIIFFRIIGEHGVPKLPSTDKFLRTAGNGGFSILIAIHGYIYLRWQRQYLKILNRTNPVSPPFLRKWIVDRYHSKVLTPEHATKIVMLNKKIPLHQLEHIVPHNMARSIVLNASPKITAFECGCRHSRPDPCLPTQVCLFIGEPFADFMREHHISESRKLTQEEALELLQAEHLRGHVHTAWFKDAMMGRFYCICNCCKCCCGGIETMVKHGLPMVASSGFVAHGKSESCSACGICIDMCPFAALSLNNNHISVNWAKCMGCGVCVDQCPSDVLALKRDEKKGMPLDVDMI